jgi:hypothetical protein
VSKKRTISLLFVVLMLAFVVGMSFALGSPSLAALGTADATSPQALVGSGFTYQGRLTDGDGNPISDTCGLDFTLWDAESGGSMTGHQIVTDVAVDGGYLTVLLNGGGEFGERPFDGQARWLKIAVKCSGDADWHILPGRQLLSATPYALSLQPGALISGTIDGRNALSVVNYGTGNALGGYSHDADGVHGQSVYGAGVSAFSFDSVAFYGESRNNTAGFFTSTHGFGVGANTFSDDPEVAAVEATNQGAGPGVVGFSSDVTGVYGHSVNGHGVEGVSVNEVGVYGESMNTAGFFTSTQGFGVGVNTFSDDPEVAAVEATNHGAGPGVVGFSNEDTGVYGYSVNGHGVEGVSVNEVAVYGQSENTAGYFTSTLSVGVHGSTTSDNPDDAAVEGVNLGTGPGVVGFSSDNTGVYGHSTNGHGVEGVSVNEVGVYGQSMNTAGYFTSTLSVGVHGSTTSDNPDHAAVEGVNLGAGPGVAGYGSDGLGGYFANQAGGIVLYAAGDVAQDATSAGLVKAAVFIGCTNLKANSYRAFNTVSGVVIIGPTGNAGECWLDFSFDLSARFWTAMAYDDTNAATVSCTLDPGDNEVLLCKRWDSAGNPLSGDIMVLVY